MEGGGGLICQTKNKIETGSNNRGYQNQDMTMQLKFYTLKLIYRALLQKFSAPKKCLVALTSDTYKCHSYLKYICNKRRFLLFLRTCSAKYFPWVDPWIVKFMPNRPTLATPLMPVYRLNLKMIQY